MAAAPQDLASARDAVTRMEQMTGARLAKANAERAALKQPDDLKAAHDKTFQKLVTAPTLPFRKSTQTLVIRIDASIKLVDYINSHRSKLSVSGTQIQAKDQRTLDEVGTLLKAHQTAGKRFAAAQRDGDRLVNGD
jgi:hypothetical protein